jgi:hypothetical protein
VRSASWTYGGLLNEGFVGFVGGFHRGLQVRLGGGCKAVRSRSIGDKIRYMPALREALGECCVDLR